MKHSCLIPICNALFIQRGHRHSLIMLKKLCNARRERGQTHWIKGHCTSVSSDCDIKLDFIKNRRKSANYYPRGCWSWRDDVTIWTHFRHYWLFVLGIHLSQLDSPSQRASDAKIWWFCLLTWTFCWSKVEFSVLWENPMLVWRDRNVCPSFDRWPVIG